MVLTTTDPSSQASLFDSSDELPHGLVYQPDFLTAAEDAGLLEIVRGFPLNEAKFQQYTARRRVVRFGEGDYTASYEPDAENVNPRRPFPGFLRPLRDRVAAWRGLAGETFVHALVTEYRPGTPIGWHSDAPHFEIVVGISLAGAARMRFRPYSAKTVKSAVVELELAARSAYVMQDEIRWQWQHQIPPARELRYSITFRTLVHHRSRRSDAPPLREQ
jgi:alkylated DNA repair dioxygenase AlkB